MKQRKFYRNMVSIVVLSEDEPLNQECDMEYISYQIDKGDMVGYKLTIDSQQIPSEEMADNLIEAGSDRSFFNID